MSDALANGALFTLAVNELTFRFSGDPAMFKRAMSEMRSSYTATITDFTKQTRQEVQSAITLQKQRSAALVAQWRGDNAAAASLQRQRSAALISQWKAEERERVRLAKEGQRQIEQAERESQRRRSAFMSGAIGGATALIGLSAVSEIRNAASAWVDYSSKLESTKIAFTTMLGSAQLAEQHLKDLQQFALTTPFQFSDLIDASQRMQALGFNAQQVIPILTDVGNAVAAAGGGAERLDRVVLAISQIQSKGKLATQEINQLAESGIPAWKILEAQFGKSRAELVKMVEQGQISSAVFLEAFQKFSQQNFGGLMEAQSKTFAGAMSNIKDALLQTSATAFAPLYERLSETARALAESSTKSKEFQENLTTAGKQVLVVWDGAVTLFYAVRDVIGLVGAVAVQVFGAITHVILATIEAVKGYYYGLQAVAHFMAGDFRGAQELANKSTQATENAANELTQALKAQGAVAEQVVRIWENAEARKAAATIAAAQKIASARLGSTFSGPDAPTSGGDLALPAGLRPGTRGAGAATGTGSGAAKRAAREQISAGQRLLNDLMERYNTLQAKTNELTVAQVIHQKLYIEGTETLRKEFANTNPEILAMIESYANLITVSQQNADVQKKIADETARQRKEAKEQDEERMRLQGQVSDELERQRDILSELQFGEKTHLQIVEEYIVATAKEAEAVGGVTDKMREYFALLIQIAIKQDEIAAGKTWKKVGEQIGFPKGDLEGDKTAPPDLSVWDTTLGALEERMQTFHAASKMYVVDAFLGMASAAESAIEAWILYGGSLGKALKQALAAELAHIAAQAAVQAMLHAAYAIGSLAFGNFASAAQHGLAAAKFSAIAAATGIAARGLAGSAAASNSGAATAGSAFQSATKVGSGSTAGKPTTADVNRRVAEPPKQVVELHLKGDLGDLVEANFVDRYKHGAKIRNLIISDGSNGG